MHEVHHILPVTLTDLRPTQMTVGLAEVAAKRAEWAQLKPKARERLLAAHWFPAVLGPGGHFFIVDHHHMGIALRDEKVRKAWVMPLDDFSSLDHETFWRLMEFRRWAHPYDQTGRRREFGDMPTRLEGLKDDPYRSLAGFVRRAGGYAKDSAPYTEFIWADYFRRQPLLKELQQITTGTVSTSFIEIAVALAHDPAARNLPGWSGNPRASVAPTSGPAGGALSLENEVAKARKAGKTAKADAAPESAQGTKAPGTPKERKPSKVSKAGKPPKGSKAAKGEPMKEQAVKESAAQDPTPKGRA